MSHVAIGQSSVINLYKGVEITDEHQVVFSSKTGQFNYFRGKRKSQITNMSYVYRDGKLKISENMVVVASCNYISFNNPAFESRPIYARIVDYSYINNVTVEITYEVDWFQTYMFDVDIDDCIIDREHLSARDYANAVDNPYRDDIPELFTEEPLAVGKLLETNYVQDLSLNKGGYMEFPNASNLDTDPNIVILIAISESADTEVGQTLLEVFDDGFDDYSVGGWRDGFPKSYVFGWIDPTGTTAGAKYNYILAKLTELGMSSSILGIYSLPKYVFDYESVDGKEVSSSSISHTSLPADGYTISINPNKMSVNPKLNRFPYSYIRATTPDNNSKEYYYENFMSVVSGGYAKLRLICNMSGIPAIYLTPYRYKKGLPSNLIGTMLYNYINDLNMNETLDFTNYPQAAFVIDSYLSYLSTVYNNAIMNKSAPAVLTRTMDIASGVGDLAKSVGQTVVSAKSGDVGGAISSGVQGLGNLMTAGVSQAVTQIGINDADRSRESSSISASRLYSGVSSAFVADEYRSGSSNGHKPYQLGKMGYVIQNVKLRDDILNKYDRFLDTYGYSSGRIGVPRVVNYIKGSGSLPYFSTVDGTTFTYCKTNDCKCISTMKPVSTFIENMFNRGCKFVKGD